MRSERTEIERGPREAPRCGAAGWNAGRMVLLCLAGLAMAGCGGEPLDTRTFEVQYVPEQEASSIIEPYIYTDRESNPGRMSVARGAITVRETPDNLERIARVLEEYDRPRSTVMLHFQIIEADGATESDPAIADVERELRRLFRFEGYVLVAETQVAGIEGTGVRQWVGAVESDRGFMIEGAVTEVRGGPGRATVTLDVALHAMTMGRVLATTVTVPAGHSVVLGTAQAPGYEGALILVVRAEVVDAAVDAEGGAGGTAPAPADSL